MHCMGVYCVTCWTLTGVASMLQLMVWQQVVSWVLEREDVLYVLLVAG